MEPFDNKAAINVLAQMSEGIPADDQDKQAAISRAVMALNIATDRAVDMMISDFLQYAESVEKEAADDSNTGNP